LPEKVQKFLEDNLTNYVYDAAKTVTRARRSRLGGPHYCGIFRVHYANAKILRILMKNLTQPDLRTATDMQQVAQLFEKDLLENGPGIVANANDPSDKRHWPASMHRHRA
jgi:hypothetical protein